MHRALHGKHYQVECVDCRFSILFDAQNAPRDYVVCPNCGGTQTGVEAAIPKPADRVTIENPDPENVSTRERNAPLRFDVVAIRHPDRPGEFAIKRIVALTGEELVIQAGDLFIDGSIVQKNQAQQTELAILVHDSEFNPSHQTAAKQGEPQPAVEDAALGFSLRWRTRPMEEASQFHWLDYQHLRGYRGRGHPRQADAVEDFYAFNQTVVRFLHRVRDLAVRFELQNLGEESLRIAFNHLTKPLLVELSSDQVTISSGDDVILATKITRVENGPEIVYCSIFDRQVLLTINEQVVALVDCDISIGESPSSNPVSIGWSGAAIRIEKLKLLRDVHYLGPGNESRAWQATGEGFVLLGDNVPISVDSRNWESCRVPLESILGTVKMID